MEKSESIKSLAGALCKAQGRITAAEKDGTNPHFKSSYATLASIWDACREALTDNELSVVQTTEVTEEGEGKAERLIIISTLLHSSGEYITGRLSMKLVKSDPQGIGSAITYGRRYALAALVGVAPDDDDGEAASGAKSVDKKSDPKEKDSKPPESKSPMTLEEVIKAVEATTTMKDFVRVFNKQQKHLKPFSDEDKKAANKAAHAHREKLLGVKK